MMVLLTLAESDFKVSAHMTLKESGIRPPPLRKHCSAPENSCIKTFFTVLDS